MYIYTHSHIYVYIYLSIILMLALINLELPRELWIIPLTLQTHWLLFLILYTVFVLPPKLYFWLKYWNLNYSIQASNQPNFCATSTVELFGGTSVITDSCFSLETTSKWIWLCNLSFVLNLHLIVLKLKTAAQLHQKANFGLFYILHETHQSRIQLGNFTTRRNFWASKQTSFLFHCQSLC